MQDTSAAMMFAIHGEILALDADAAYLRAHCCWSPKRVWIAIRRAWLYMELAALCSGLSVRAPLHW